ncbi:hypothetical protein D1AOALGA4SA_11368 [Olavius algarvensis Delta 1 endosymbiont]|nr:hypothetical protein D1AOALGA4SA_11368 [Olavius algarvensis Delta 1 endosymbiont]
MEIDFGFVTIPLKSDTLELKFDYHGIDIQRRIYNVNT